MRESGSTLIAIIIILEGGVCEQAEHVESPQEMEYDVAMKTRTNLVFIQCL